ncbi:tetratricopeptide repeat protein [bacterium SCSIO 12643]|nr:tetratricopeptide repeat protein [bacterium SCSIO 12643]
MKNLFLVLFLSVLVWSCDTEPKKTVDQQDQPKENVKEDSLGWINTQILENPNDPGLYIAKARYMLEKGSVENAVIEADKAIGLDSNNIAYYNFKADAYYDAQDMLNAKEVYLKVLEKDEENEHANQKMAWISLIAGQHESCFTYANNVLKQNQYIPEPYYLKGLAYKELGNFKLAVSNFRTATEQDNDYIEAWLQLGYMYDVAEDTLAGAFYENALRIDSNNIDALYAFGMHLQDWGIARDAINQYEHILRVNDGYQDAYYNIGFIYLEMLQENDSAIMYYDKLLALNPYNFKGYYNRGLAFERNEMFPQALSDYDKALELKPDYTPAAKGKSRVIK